MPNTQEEVGNGLKPFPTLDFLSHVSLQLSTPLSITREGLSLLFTQIQDKITQKEGRIFKVLVENLERASETVNNLIDMYKIESGEMTFKRRAAGIKEILSKARLSFEPRIKARGLQFVYRGPARDVEIYGNPDRVGQIFNHLLSNALEFTDKGSIEIAAEEKEKQVECSVTDTGTGIASEFLPRAFLKFEHGGLSETDPRRGAGLGLAVAKGLVNLHQGKIWIESQAGKGTKVIFTLPKMVAVHG